MSRPSAAQTVTGPLRQAFETWRGRPLVHHAGAVLLLSLLVTARFHVAMVYPEPLPDEKYYIAAFEKIVEGESPYTRRGFLYPPAFAWIGAQGYRVLGAEGMMALNRIANVVGVAALAWFALAWSAWRWRWRLLAAGAFLVIAPAVSFGVVLGNLSLAVAAMIVLGLLLWDRLWDHRKLGAAFRFFYSGLAGLLFGASIALKPIAPGAVVVLGGHRPSRRTIQHWLAAGLGLALGATLFLAFPYLDEMLRLAAEHPLRRTVSFHRFPHLLGWDVSAIWVSAIVAILALWLVRRRHLGPSQVMAAAIATALATTPIVWSHTLLLALPLQGLSLEVAARRYLGDRRRSRLYQLLFVILGVGALQLSLGATMIDDQSALVQWFGVLPPALAPGLLAAYVIRVTEPF